MGRPVEQQKYQSLGSVVLELEGSGEVSGYQHELDLDTAVATTTYTRGGGRLVRDDRGDRRDAAPAARGRAGRSTC